MYSADRITKYSAKILLLFGIGLGLFALFTNINGPILDSYGFRQTQTAISAFYLARGGPIFTYETPILGAPWAVPFEFPTMQLFSAGLNVLGVPLDAAGRLVSFAFFIACLFPLYFLFRTAKSSETSYWVAACLFVTSPLHIFWGRSFLIESTALFTSLCWLAFYVKIIEERKFSVFHMILTLVLGALAATTKSTTFFAFLVFAFFWTLKPLFIEFKKRDLNSILRGSITGLALACIPLFFGYAWVVWTDHIKTFNEIGRLLTSSALTSWNFGTIEQRISIGNWNSFFERMFPDIFGVFSYYTYILILVHIFIRNYSWFVFCSICAFLATILVFTNLHFIHSYYQMSIALFVILPIAIAISKIPSIVSPIILVSIWLSQVVYFLNVPYGIIKADHYLNVEYRTALAVYNSTENDDMILVIGHDWDSTIPYYSQRKALMLPAWAPQEIYDRELSQKEKYSLIVHCADTNDKVVKALEQIKKVGLTEQGQVERCTIFR